MILFIDACVRENSRTRELANTLTDCFFDEVERLELYKENLPEMSEEILNFRTQKSSVLDFSDEYFKYAMQFASADTVVIAAPFWDLSFPAILKKYIESICISGLSFKYSEDGIPKGLCKARNFYFITTFGGRIFDNSFSFGYLKSLFEGMLGVEHSKMFSAENLDIIGSDVDTIMQKAKEEIRKELNAK